MKTKIPSSKFRPAKIEVKYNPELDKYDPQMLFPEKLAKANEALKKHPIPEKLLQR